MFAALRTAPVCHTGSSTNSKRHAALPEWKDGVPLIGIIGKKKAKRVELTGAVRC